MNNKFTNSLLILAVGGLMLAGSASAQTSTTTSVRALALSIPAIRASMKVNRREENQQQRIGNGVKNGTLNSRQTANLEKRETSVQNREQRDMAKNNGHLTKAEQKGINRQQNRISKRHRERQASQQVIRRAQKLNERTAACLLRLFFCLGSEKKTTRKV